MSRPRTARRATTVAAAFAATALLLVPGAAARVPCEDLLVTHRPDGSSGDTAAASVTSQTLERGAGGWSSVSWDVASSVDVRTVVVESAAGERELPANQRTADGTIDAVHVCGTSSSSAATPPADDTSTRPAAAAVGDVGGGSATGQGLLGATVGALLGAVVLLLSRGARRSAEVMG